jgi:hypothetical protein
MNINMKTKREQMKHDMRGNWEKLQEKMNKMKY